MANVRTAPQMIFIKFREKQPTENNRIRNREKTEKLQKKSVKFGFGKTNQTKSKKENPEKKAEKVKKIAKTGKKYQ